MTKKLLVVTILLAITAQSFAAYDEIDCSTDPVFAENSCNQCFDWWNRVEGDFLGMLTDLWTNATDVKKILYKEEQTDPEMINLDPTNVEWTQNPSTEGFWEFTEEFDALYNEEDDWYVLEPGASVTWLKSWLSSAYKLEKNAAEEWKNIGLLIYPIVSHNILEDWEVTIDNNKHNECVLFKSWEPTQQVVETPKKLPDTGPAEYFLLAILALILGFGVLQFRTKS